MSFPQLSGDEQNAAENLGSLEGYLGNQRYTTAQVPMSGEQVVRNSFGVGPVSEPGPADYAPQGVAPQGQPAQQQPGISMDQWNAMVSYAQRMEQTANTAAQDAIAAEERQFLAQLDFEVEMGRMTESQRDVQIVLRRNQQLETSQQTMAQRIQADADRQEEAEQMDAKTRISFREAMAHGVNWFNPDVRNAIMEAESLEDMQSKLRVLRMYPGALLTPEMMRAAGQQQPQAQAPQQQPQQTQAQVAAGVFAAAGGRGGGTPPAQVKKGSGDLGRYIQAKGGYQSVAVE